MDDRPGGARISRQDNAVDTPDQEKLAKRARNAHAVSEYLLKHPRFFLDNPHIVAKLRVPHPVEGAVSLIEYQNRMLRDVNRSLRRRIKSMLQVARENEEISERIHELNLRLVEARSPRELFDSLGEALLNSFRSDFAATSIFADQAGHTGVPCEEFLGCDHPNVRIFKSWVDQGTPVIGRLSAEHRRALFDEHGGGVRSAVVMPLQGADWSGVVAAGSRESGRFRADMGFDMLAQVAQLTSLLLDRWIAR